MRGPVARQIGGEPLDAFLFRERRQGDPEHRLGVGFARERPGERGRSLPVPAGDDKDDRAGHRVPDEVVQELQGRRVRPVHVVQRHHQATGPAQSGQQPRDGPVETETVGGRRRRSGSTAAEDPGDRVRQAGRVRRAVVQIGERVGERMEREVPLVLRRPAAQHRHPTPPCTQAQLRHQPALADPRFAGDVDEGRGPLPQPVDHRVEQPQFDRTADKWASAVVMGGSAYRCSLVCDLSTELHGIVYHAGRTAVRESYEHRTRPFAEKAASYGALPSQPNRAMAIETGKSTRNPRTRAAISAAINTAT